MKNNASALMKKVVFVLIIIAILSNNADAVKLVQLTTSEIDEYDPAWSPDGTKIAYIIASNPNYVVDSIGVMAENGGLILRDSGPPDEIYSRPRHEPTWKSNGEIAYEIGGYLYLWDFAGGHRFGEWSNLLPVDRYVKEYMDEHPSFSVDGTLTFTSYRSGNKDIWIYNGGLKQLTTNNSTDEYPAWNYNGSQIAFASDRSGTKEIWIMDRDGSNSRQLTNFKSTTEKPTWSPDSTKIAFTSYRSGNSDIWVINTDGTNAKQLTANESDDGSPTWWPKSNTEKNKIAFTSDRSGNKDIWVMEFNESELSGTVGGSKVGDEFRQYLPYLGAAILVGFFFVFKERILLGYYSLRMKKWKKEGYDMKYQNWKRCLKDENQFRRS